MNSKMKLLLPLVLVTLAVAGGVVTAETNSYFDKGYEFAALKTWDFKAQRRISTDPIANNSLWADDIRTEITRDLQSNGFEPSTNGGRPDFLVAFYVGLQQKYDVQYMDYGYPGFWGSRRYGASWGWGAGDVWQVPYTDSTLIVDVIDGQTNQLIWRGYDVNTIDMKKPEKRLDKAVDSLVKKFLKDTARPTPQPNRSGGVGRAVPKDAVTLGDTNALLCQKNKLQRVSVTKARG